MSDSEPVPPARTTADQVAGPFGPPGAHFFDDNRFDPEISRESDLDLASLDDIRDRPELRNRYYGLLQELRVVLPGVQVMLAFLFTVPFTEGFRRMDSFERGAFGVAILSSLLAVICMLAPAAMHRFGERTARRARLAWSIRLTMAGFVFLALGLVAALWAVARFVYGTGTALLVAVPVSLSIPVLWWLLPMRIGRSATSRYWTGAGDAGSVPAPQQTSDGTDSATETPDSPPTR
jgi:hypothetical protein